MKSILPATPLTTEVPAQMVSTCFYLLPAGLSQVGISHLLGEGHFSQLDSYALYGCVCDLVGCLCDLEAAVTVKGIFSSLLSGKD